MKEAISADDRSIQTILDVLRERAKNQADKIAYRFLAEGREHSAITFAELDRQARQVAAELQKTVTAGSRALLLQPSGIDYIVAFFGSLYAGVIAVPLSVPALRKKRRTKARIESVIADADPSVILTAGPAPEEMQSWLAGAAKSTKLHWLDTTAITKGRAEFEERLTVCGEHIAFLQYTSGSTSAPRGVMVTHANIIRNQAMMMAAFGTRRDSVIVGWLPLYHDMGLIGNVLHPLYAGVPCILMSPITFLQNPLFWLRAISHYRATISGGPNFAYELCVRKINPEDRKGLDLSCWERAFNGAEPVRAETLERFSSEFADSGFRKNAFCPCYGLAEATLFVAGTHAASGPAVLNVDGGALARNQVRAGTGKDAKEVVACGFPSLEEDIRIVSSDSLCPSAPNEVGEVWVRGPNITKGYWRRSEESKQTFGACITGTTEGGFLRTGDLGFLNDGQLYITGRLKDLLIIRGQNHYPQDLELTVERSDSSLQAGCGAAFSIDAGGEDRLVIVQESSTRTDKDLARAFRMISQRIVEEHEIAPYAVVLIRAGTIPKTSSGKIQRHACKAAYLKNELHVLKEWQEGKTVSATVASDAAKPRLENELERWLVKEIAARTGISPEEVDIQQPFTAFGLDSLIAIELAHKIQVHFGLAVEMADLFDDVTLAEFARTTTAPQSYLKPVEITEGQSYPLSYGQRALWFLHQLAPESTAYNISRAIRIRGEIDAKRLKSSFQDLVNRHACLRTKILEMNGEPMQQVDRDAGISFEHIAAQHWAFSKLDQALLEQSQKVFDLTRGPLFRVQLYTRADDDHILQVTLDHIIADLWSLMLLLDELGKLYQARQEKLVPQPGPLQSSYAEFVAWQREHLAGAQGEYLWQYWRDELCTDFPPLHLPLDRPRPPAPSYQGGSLSFVVGQDLSEKIGVLAASQQITPFTILMAGYQILLHRITSQKQIAVGCPTTGRPRAEFANIVGYFVNPLPLRADFTQQQTLRRFLVQVRNRVVGAFEHDMYPFPLMVEKLGIARDAGSSPIFQTMLVVQKNYGEGTRGFLRFAIDAAGGTSEIGGLTLEPFAMPDQAAQFDLTLTIAEGPQGFIGSWQFRSGLFDVETIARWSESLRTLLEAMNCELDIPVAQLTILPVHERQQLLFEFNRTDLPFDAERCLHQTFEWQARLNPSALAIVHADSEYSYEQIDVRSNQTAHYLKRLGIKSGDLVGICMKRSPEMVQAMLALWKAGAAYVPLDPQYPQERLRFMVEDAAARIVLTETDLREKLEKISTSIVCLDSEAGRVAAESPQALNEPISSLQMAYMIYTSGSTGLPKGVMLTHRNVMSFVAWAGQNFTREELSGVLAATSICFDLSIFELWATLALGGAVILAEDVLSWWDSLREEKDRSRVTLINTVPSAMAKLIQQGRLPDSIVTVNLAGEALQETLVNQIYKGSNVKHINNLYGPSETTTYSTWMKVENDQKVAIGEPIANTQVYVLDQELELAPIGTTGELYISGAGLGHGYWQRPSLTAEKFFPNPFGNASGERMYRTGDLVRRRPSGPLEFIGRSDQQVKVRGYRIELGEIEAALSESDVVRENVVVVQGEGTDQRIVAYVALPSSSGVSEEELLQHLRKRLPRYMVPSQIVQLDSLPKTSNGKVDRKALPLPRQAEKAGREPRNETETIIAGIWAEVLDREQIGAEQSFFELGGHSLLATQMISRIRQAFQVELPLRSVFETQTVAGLAGLVRKAARTDAPPLRSYPREGHLPLSFAQERLWFLSRYEVEISLYNVPVALRLRGPLDENALKAALRQIVARHEVLRTSFPEINEEAVQSISPALELQIPVVEVNKNDLPQLLRQHAREPFDIRVGPLVHAMVLRLHEQESVLLVVFHHIVCDGWSLGIMMSELMILYDACRQNAAAALSPLNLQYVDFALWQREWLQGEFLTGQLEYWTKQLAKLEPLDLPTDKPRPVQPSLAGATEIKALPPALVSELKLFSRRHDVTLFMILLASFDVLLHRYAGSNDIAVGSPIANRTRQELEPLVGFFVNTIVLRNFVFPELPVAKLLQQIRETSLQAYAHQDIPFERLVEVLDPVRDPGSTPLFQVMFVLQNAPLVNAWKNGLEVTPIVLDTGTSKFDMTMALREEGKALEISLEYRTDLFERESIVRFLHHYRTLLEAIVAGQDKRIGEIDLLTRSEKEHLLNICKGAPTEFPQYVSVCQLFEEQAALIPEQTAIIGDGTDMTYRELNERANQVACYLQRFGIGPESLVGICMERSTLMLVGLLAILKSGAAYLPLDADYPADRISFMVKSAHVQVLLTQESLAQRFGCATVCVDSLWPEIEREPATNRDVRVFPENLGYVLYTSGSTGKPKGIAMSHGALTNLIHWQLQRSSLRVPRTLQFTSSSFDVSFQEIFATWCGGGSLVLIDEATRRDGSKLWKVLSQQKIEQMFLPFAALQQLAEVVNPEGGTIHLREIITAGEQLKITPAIERLFSGLHACILENQYGPTESHVVASYRLPEQRALWPQLPPIGTPIANTTIYVLDDGIDLLPIGVAGELYISGCALARGYLGNPSLTAVSFLPDPFSSFPGSRMYRTGDLARLRPDGNIEYLGRKDRQVKIRGYRVEPGEVEAVLQQYPGVRQAAVVAVRGERAYLAAYVLLKAESKTSVAHLRQYLKNKLPEYMVPGPFIILEKLPLTPSGKVDQRALPKPDASSMFELNSGAPLTPTEELIAGTWSNLLGVSNIGKEDNFFDLGGHSLVVTQMFSRLHQLFGREMSFRSIFEFPVLKDFAASIDVLNREAAPNQTRPIRHRKPGEALPLSLQQEQLWFLDRYTSSGAAYSLPGAVRLKGKLNKQALEFSLHEIVRRHEVLRTSFVQPGARPVQQIHQHLDFELPEQDLRGLGNGISLQERIDREMKEEAARPFTLSEPGLLRARLLRLAEQEHILLVTIHHIVFDGWSVGVLVRELKEFYQANCEGRPPLLEELKIQYADYAVWQRELLANGELSEGLEYWKGQLQNLPVIELPSDHPRPAIQTFRGTTEDWKVAPELSAALNHLSREHGVTLFMTLLTGWQILLARYTGETDIVVGSPIANRIRPELEPLIGFFVNTLVLRTRLGMKLSVEEVFHRTREVCLGAYAHQSVPFENLVDEFEPQRGLSHNPLFQVAIVLQNSPLETMQLPDLEMRTLPSAATGSKFDLTLVIEEWPEGLQGSVEYGTDLFESGTIRQIIRHYKQILSEMSRDACQEIGTLAWLTEAESRHLIADWNGPARAFSEQCIHHLFEMHAQQTPSATAVSQGHARFTYAELNLRANQLGNYLRKQGIGPERLAGICVDSGMEMIAAILAVLKAGGAYVLLNPDTLAEQMGRLGDTALAILITQQRLLPQLSGSKGRILNLDEHRDQILRESVTNCESAVSGSNAAYIAYNAHSVPAIIQHGNAAAVLRAGRAEFPAEAMTAVVCSSPCGSEFAGFDLLLPLSAGDQLILTETPFDFSGIPSDVPLTLVNTPSGVLRQFVRTKKLPSSIRTVGLPREAVPAGLVSKIYAGGHVNQVFNGYGSAEVTDICIRTCLPRGEESGVLPIGRPLQNTSAYVLDAELKPVPMGVAGELHIGGPALARGYWNNCSLTAQRFIPNPFVDSGERLFRTGERARYKTNGVLELIEGGDSPLKVYGRRVSLTEIETTLLRLQSVADAKVLPGDMQQNGVGLTAYVVADESVGKTAGWQQPWLENLRSAMKRRVPEYMVPAEWVPVDELPLNRDGKLDAKKLAESRIKDKVPAFAALPRNDTEQIISEIWKRVLKIEEVGTEENFFDVGGHSLVIPEIHIALQENLKLNFEIVELFQYPTIHSLAEHLEAQRVQQPLPAAAAKPEMGRAVVSPEKPGRTETSKIPERALAIIGMACRFPGAKNVEEFWRNLRAGIESMVDLSDEELRLAGIDEAIFSSPNYIKRGAILDHVDLFDARFFNMSAREAELIDPQQRVFLECAWEALEYAGYASEDYKGKIGVYAGSGAPTYLLNLLVDHKSIDTNEATPMLFANANDFLATRAAYKLNLTGPAVTIQTACSTSLVAVHVAGRALLNRECDIAMAGGITIRTPQGMGDTFTEGGIVSPDGHCRAFDEQAQGTVRANGAGIVVLKRLEDAVRDHDHIHAVIRGSAVNNDGAQKVGYAAPSVVGQRQVIQDALRDSGVEPETITYVEAHGTATPLGDPIEITALMQAFQPGTDKKGFCAIGSVKSNIGHTDCAAGVAGLIKTVLALENKEIPPSLHFQRANPKIDFSNSPFHVNATLSEWTAGEMPRRAGISSFGIGGTNAHVIVEEAPLVQSGQETRPYQMLLLSAKTSTALEAATSDLAKFLRTNAAVRLADIAYTLQTGRREFTHRRVIVCSDSADALNALDTLDIKGVFTGFHEPRTRPVVFMLPGQGAQYLNMAKGLYDSEAIFKTEVDICAMLLQGHLGFDIREVIYPTSDTTTANSARLMQTEVTQPALFVIEYSLARLWMEWGIHPHAMIGHSIGEYVAACLAGVMSLEDALVLVAARGKLMQRLPRGSMLVVPLPEKEVVPLLGDGLSLAAVNSPGFTVVSGTDRAIQSLEDQLSRQKLACRRLQTSHAFHSSMMEPILGPFAAECKKISFHSPKIPYLSNLSGTWITHEEATSPDYWVGHLRNTVRFDDGLRQLLKDPDWVLLEVGPGRTLATLARWNPYRSQGQVVVNCVRHPDDAVADPAFMLAAAGKLWMTGARFDWERFYQHEKRKHVVMPAYPFERQRYWIEPVKQSTASPSRIAARKNSNPEEWFYLPSWKRTALAPVPIQEIQGGSWLIFSDGFGIGAGLEQEARRRSIEVFSVTRGLEYRQLRDSFVVRPDIASDFQTLFRTLENAGKIPSKIIYLWTIADGTGQGRAGLTSSFFAPLFIAQAIGSLGYTPPIEWLIGSNLLHDVTGEAILDPERATLLGHCYVVPQEFPNISCRNIDIDFSSRESLSAKTLSNLLDEITSACTEKVVAYRRGRRWIRVFEHLRVPPPSGQLLLRQAGHYLITGGLGGVGMAIAEHLAQTTHARLVLVGRTPFPARSEWQHWLSVHSEEESTGLKIRRLQSMEKIGAEVFVANADVSDEQQMRAVVADAQDRFGPLHGVLHCAGVPGGEVIQLKTRQMAEAVLASKVQGTTVLASVLGQMPLDFFIACSSRTSIMGSFGQVDYCAANAFLDAFAHYSHQNGSAPMVAINWDAWIDVGMLTNAASPSKVADAGPVPKENREKVDHPLLDIRVVESADREAYLTTVSPLTHWVLDEHRIAGNPIIPGTAYLEMVRAAVERYAIDRDIEIRDVFFLAPLGLREDEKRQVRLVLEKHGEGFTFHILGSPVDNSGAEQAWSEYATGKVAFVRRQPLQPQNLEQIAKKCDVRQVALTDDSKRDEDLGPRWQSFKHAYIGKHELLALLEFPEQFIPDLEKLRMHPSLLDRALEIGKEFLVPAGVYLPMGYRRLTIRRPLEKRIYAHVRFSPGERQDGETVSCDVTVLNERGEELLQIESFSQKRVNDIAAQIKAVASRQYRQKEEKSPAQPSVLASLYAREREFGLSTSEGVEAFRRILSVKSEPQIIVSTRELESLILDSTRQPLTELLEQTLKTPVAAGSKHPRPALDTSFRAPSAPMEQTIAVIWQQVLGIDQIGVDDNFFDLGGDSVQGIQIVARINEQGVQLTAQQLFQYQTVAELAAAVSTVHVTQPAVVEQVSTIVSEESSAGFHPASMGVDEKELQRLEEILEEAPHSNGQSHGLQANTRGLGSVSGEPVFEGFSETLKTIENTLREHPSVADVLVQRAGEAWQTIQAFVVLKQEPGKAPDYPMRFGLFYFADSNSTSGDKYRLYLEGAKFADCHDFHSVWTPERHFHQKGGLYPNPSVLSSALAATTHQVQLRAGSVVMPLHNPLRVAEEWSIVDNLSHGRVGLSFASGWVANDFAFFPDRYANKRVEMFKGIAQVQKLWRGEKILITDGTGKMVEIGVFPRPIQRELPVWLTCSGAPEMFIKAGELGFNVLTSLQEQSFDEVAVKLRAYRDAREAAGHDPSAGKVTMMMHTFVGQNKDRVLDKVRAPLTAYLHSHIELIKTSSHSLDIQKDLKREGVEDSLVAFAFERYHRTASLIGTPETCLPMVNRLKSIGVYEVACLVDFGVDVESVLESLEYLNILKESCQAGPPLQTQETAPDATRALVEFLEQKLPPAQVPGSLTIVDSLSQVTAVANQDALLSKV